MKVVTDKLQLALVYCLVIALCQLERRVERDQEEFESISRQLRKELHQFDRQRCGDFQTSITVYLESLMNTQQQVRLALIQGRI